MDLTLKILEFCHLKNEQILVVRAQNNLGSWKNLSTWNNPFLNCSKKKLKIFIGQSHTNTV